MLIRLTMSKKQLTEHLFSAVSRDDVTTAKLLIKAGADINGRKGAKNNTVLIIAANRQNLKMMKMLLNHGAPINARNSDLESAIHVCATWGYLEGIKLLLSRRSLAQIGNIELCTPLMLACMKGHYAIVEYFLNHGVTMQYQGHDDVVKLLLDAGDPSRDRSEEMNYAILNAMISQNARVVRLLLEHGADPNFTRLQLQRPIFSAISNTDLPMLNLLIDYKVDVNARDSNGFTPLMIAVLGENEAIVRRLIEAGGDVHAKHEGKNKSVLSLAEKTGSKTIIEVIQSAM